jgi:propanediol dehydratase small subunit
MQAEYPLSEKCPERLRTPSGLRFEDITLDALLEGRVPMEDLRVTAEALEMQAQIAESAGRPQLADNLRRAAELVAIPEDEVLAIYDSLRPGRATPAELLQIAATLEEKHGGGRCARLIREAAGSADSRVAAC